MNHDHEIGVVLHCRQVGRREKVSRHNFIYTKKSILMARVIIAMLTALFRYRPRYALGLKMSQYQKLIRILADWKLWFTRACPGIYTLYYTEFVIRTIGRMPNRNEQYHKIKSNKINPCSKKTYQKKSLKNRFRCTPS